MPNNKNRKLIITSLVLLAGTLIAWQAVLYWQHRGKIGVKVVVVPSDSVLKIDDRPAKPGKVYLTSGVHQLSASRKTFSDATRPINTADITKGQVIYMMPAPSSAAAKNYLLQNPAVQQQREAVGGAEAAQTQDFLMKKYPIIAKLPYETARYRIDYSIDPNQKLYLIVTTYGSINSPSDYPEYVKRSKAHRQEALGFLQQNGINPATSQITYTPDL